MLVQPICMEAPENGLISICTPLSSTSSLSHERRRGGPSEQAKGGNQWRDWDLAEDEEGYLLRSMQGERGVVGCSAISVFVSL